MVTKEKPRPKQKGAKLILFLTVLLIFLGVGAIQISKNPMLIQNVKTLFSDSFGSIIQSGNSKSTKEAYDNLENGMSMDDVKVCLGENVMLTRSDLNTYMFVIEYENGKEDTATIKFADDKLIQKSLFSEQRSLVK